MTDRGIGQPPLVGDLFDDQGLVDADGIPLRWELSPGAWHPFWTDSVVSTRANLVRQVVRWRELRGSGLAIEVREPPAAGLEGAASQTLRGSSTERDGSDFEQALIEWWSTARESVQGGWDQPSWEQWRDSAHEELEQLLRETPPDPTVWPVLDQLFGSLEIVDRFAILGTLLTAWASAARSGTRDEERLPAAVPTASWLVPWMTRWQAVWHDAQQETHQGATAALEAVSRHGGRLRGLGGRTIWPHSLLTWQSLLQDVSTTLQEVPVTSWGLDPQRIVTQSHRRVWAEVVEVVLAHPTPPEDWREWLAVWAQLREIDLTQPAPMGRSSGGADGETIVESSVTLLRLLERGALSPVLPDTSQETAMQQAVVGPLSLHLVALWTDVARALPPTPEGVTRWADLQMIAAASLRWAARGEAPPPWWSAFGAALLAILEAVAEAPHQVERERWSRPEHDPWPAELLSRWLELDARWSATPGEGREGRRASSWDQVRRLLLPPLFGCLAEGRLEVEWGARFLIGCPRVVYAAWPPAVWKGLLLSSRRDVRLWALAHHPAAQGGHGVVVPDPLEGRTAS